MGMLLILVLMVIWVVTTDSPFLPLHLLPLPKNPQLLKPERNVKLRLKLIPKLGIMATTDMDMADTMVDTTDILDMDMLTTDKQINTQTSILKEEKNNCHQTKLNQKTAAT